MGLHHDARKAAKREGVYDELFGLPDRECRARADANRERYKGMKWISHGGEGVRFAYTSVALPQAGLPEVELLDIDEPIPEEQR